MRYVVVSRINYEVFYFCIQGIVPHGYLAMEGSELAVVMYANTRQMLEQYKFHVEDTVHAKFNLHNLLFIICSCDKLITIKRFAFCCTYTCSRSDCYQIMRYLVYWFNIDSVPLQMIKIVRWESFIDCAVVSLIVAEL